MDETEIVRRAFEAIQIAWRSGNTAALRPLFHPDMIIVGPDYQRFATGRQAAIESYAEFAANTQVVAYSAEPPEIHVWGDTAICSVRWTLTWQRTAGQVAEKGSDQLVFSRFEDEWLAVYRLILFEPQEPAPTPRTPEAMASDPA